MRAMCHSGCLGAFSCTSRNATAKIGLMTRLTTIRQRLFYSHVVLIFIQLLLFLLRLAIAAILIIFGTTADRNYLSLHLLL